MRCNKKLFAESGSVGEELSSCAVEAKSRRKNWIFLCEYLPDSTLCFKKEKIQGCKNSKVRVTLLICVNMDSSKSSNHL